MGLGSYYLGPFSESGNAPLQDPASVAYTRKDFSGYWEFYPDELPAEEQHVAEL